MDELIKSKGFHFTGRCGCDGSCNKYKSGSMQGVEVKICSSGRFHIVKNGSTYSGIKQTFEILIKQHLGL